MKLLVGILFLIACGSTQATNFYYMRVMNQDTAEYDVLYLSDKKDSKLCPGEMLIATRETREAKHVNTLCWQQVIGGMASTFQLYDPKTGLNYTGPLELGLVPGGEKAYAQHVENIRAKLKAAGDKLNDPDSKPAIIHP